MRIPRADAPRLLGYCTNVHPAETEEGILDALRAHAIPARRQVCGDEPLGVGLWLPAPVARSLRDPGRARRFRDELQAIGLFAFTLNAFPYGGFHERVVKERVFRPAWDTRERLEYTLDCTAVLAHLLPDGVTGSISTVPVGLAADRTDVAAAAEHLREAARALARLEHETGRRIVLALEPEPCAVLDRVAQAARFLDEQVLAGAGEAARRYLGVCVDACHEAVMHCDPRGGIEELERRGVEAGKVQITAAVRIRHPGRDHEALRRLEAFDEGRYFHQAAWREADGRLAVVEDLAPFLERARRGDVAADEARVHFHVPVFATLEGPILTTRAHLEQVLSHALASGVTHFEVETYTFDVIPAAERESLGASDLAGLIARELAWSKDFLVRT